MTCDMPQIDTHTERDGERSSCTYYIFYVKDIFVVLGWNPGFCVSYASTHHLATDCLLCALYLFFYFSLFCLNIGTDIIFFLSNAIACILKDKDILLSIQNTHLKRHYSSIIISRCSNVPCYCRNCFDRCF